MSQKYYEPMVEPIDLKTLDVSYPHICIPRVLNTISELQIRQIFNELEFGNIKYIHIVRALTVKGEMYGRVYIRLDKWLLNEKAQTVRRKLLLGKEIKIVYDNPWFWKISANKYQSHTNFNKKQEEPIILEDNDI